MLATAVGGSSSGILTIFRIAYRREEGDGTAQRGRSVIYDCLVMAALWNRADHYIFVLWFLLSIFFFLLFPSPILSRRRRDVYHTSTHGVAALVRIYGASQKSAARGSLKIQDAKYCQKLAICAPLHNFVGLCLRNKGTYRQSEKAVKQQYLPLMSSQYSEIRRTSG